jgi:hypothetical protein
LEGIYLKLKTDLEHAHGAKLWEENFQTRICEQSEGWKKVLIFLKSY